MNPLHVFVSSFSRPSSIFPAIYA